MLAVQVASSIEVASLRSRTVAARRSPVRWSKMIGGDPAHRLCGTPSSIRQSYSASLRPARTHADSGPAHPPRASRECAPHRLAIDVRPRFSQCFQGISSPEPHAVPLQQAQRLIDDQPPLVYSRPLDGVLMTSPSEHPVREPLLPATGRGRSLSVLVVAPATVTLRHRLGEHPTPLHASSRDVRLMCAIAGLPADGPILPARMFTRKCSRRAPGSQRRLSIQTPAACTVHGRAIGHSLKAGSHGHLCDDPAGPGRTAESASKSRRPLRPPSPLSRRPCRRRRTRRGRWRTPRTPTAPRWAAATG